MSDINQEAAWDYIRDGYLLAPRTVLKKCVKRPPADLSCIRFEETILSGLLQQRLEIAMGPLTVSRRSVMFSGGFDSILMASLARRLGAEVTTITVEFDDFNPLTVAGAVQAANQLGMAHRILHVKAVEFLAAFEALAGLTDEPILDLDLAIVHAAFKKYDPKLGGDHFISGMGSDQWFGDLARLANVESLAVRMDWAMVDEQAHHRVVESHGCKIVFPFLSRPMLEIALSIPDAMKKDKKLLRGLAVAQEIPDRGARSEIQVPALMRDILIKTYGHRAWPEPLKACRRDGRELDQALRQIVLGLWLDKSKDRF